MTTYQQRAREQLVWGNSRVDALGSQSLWGFSAALDVLEPFPEGDEEAPVNVLLMCPGDVRHILRTLGERRFGSEKKMQRPIHFYIYEDLVELLARHLLLLRVALDWELSIRKRAALFLEIFGNAMLQEETAAYLGKLGDELAGLAYGNDAESLLGYVVDLDKLKFKERDLLISDAFTYWARGSCNLADLWNRRIRSTLGSRYDSRTGVFDWDYRSGLEKQGAGIVHVKQYRQWRETGVAFEFVGDSSNEERSHPNLSFATFTEGYLKAGKDQGHKKEVRGFWGDTAVGPYVSLGLDAQNAAVNDVLLAKVDKGTGTERYRHNATVVAAYNLIKDLWCLETGTKYDLPNKNDIYSGLLDADSRLDDHSHKDQWDRLALERAENILKSLDHIKIIPLCGNKDLQTAIRRLRPRRDHPNSNELAYLQFDVVTLGYTAAHHIDTPFFASLLKPGASVFVEGSKFLLPLALNQRLLYTQKLHAMALANGLAPAYPTQPALDHVDDVVKNLLGNCPTAPSDLNPDVLRFTYSPNQNSSSSSSSS